MKYILTSNGLTSDGIRKEFFELFNCGFTKVGIVVTADNVYKEKSWLALEAKRSFEEIGFKTEYIDFDYFNGDLNTYDILYFIGGNPFYLMDALLKNEVISPLKDYCSADKKIISGASAGAIILGKSLELVHEFDPQLNDDINLEDLRALNLCNINICPHYSRFINKYNDFEKRIKRVEKRIGSEILRIDDGEAIVYQDGKPQKHIER